METTYIGCANCGADVFSKNERGFCNECGRVWEEKEYCQDCMRPVERCYCETVMDLLSKAQSILSSVKAHYMDWPERQRDLMAIAVSLIDRADAIVADEPESVRDECHHCDGIGAVEERDGWDLCPVCKGRGYLKAVQTA